MKTQKCIIRLTFVPESICKASDGDIANGMYLQRYAMDSLLNGEMFSGLDCLWGHANIVTEEDAERAVEQLQNFGISARIITIS